MARAMTKSSVAWALAGAIWGRFFIDSPVAIGVGESVFSRSLQPISSGVDGRR